ncbi:MAG: tRNA uridine-5-carboxymethylaminomethyl(34) synthesis enzyme MnmG [Candidatus Eisenbacteria bacterium]
MDGRRHLTYAASPGAPSATLSVDAASAATRAGSFDVVVIGAGHAGCEAANACAQMGLSTALLTVKIEDTAKMSCNPAIGGIAKGHMVREIDALGGLMARITDRAGIQFKMLNRGRGPAVWSPRAQCDKAAYSAAMIDELARVAKLQFVTGIAERVLLTEGRVTGVGLTDGRRLTACAVVITPGTFLNGLIHIGERRIEGGRIGEHAARALSDCLAGLGLERGRLKTGTPPRLLHDSIDWDAVTPAPGDAVPEPFSHWTERLDVEQVLCWATHTNGRTHDVIRTHMHRSPLYSGQIQGIGPRYCPSLEDKVVKFPERVSHHIFLEPEGRTVDEIYANGVSTSMPEEIQLEFLRTIAGLEHCEMLRPGYAVEYDFVLPHQLDASLQCRAVPGLFLAGQICGTSGYEEAAAQGFMAGVNAAHQVLGRPPFVLRRDQAYLGVLVDDLVTREHHEPYRMFTSAAEYRLLLRADNADERLAELGHDLGLLSLDQVEQVRGKVAGLAAEERRLARVSMSLARLESARLLDLPAIAAPDGAAPASPERATQTRRVPALDWLARPQGTYAHLVAAGLEPLLPLAWRGSLEVRVKYRGYIERQEKTAAAGKSLEDIVLPAVLWEESLHGLSSEALEKLRRWRPTTAARAARIAGVSPSDVAILLVHARRCRPGR